MFQGTPVSAVPEMFDSFDLMVDGFLARYESPATRAAYAGDVALWRSWCSAAGLDPLKVERSHIEFYGRWLSTERGNGAASVNRRLVVLRSFYRTLVNDRVLDHSPAEFVRLPRVRRDKSQYVWLSRAEMSSIVRAADDVSMSAAALVALMGTLGLRVSEACSLDVDSADRYESGHRMVSFVGKGNKRGSTLLPPSVARRFDAARGDRVSGPLLLSRSGERLSRRSAARQVAVAVSRAGVEKRVSPHDLRAAAISLAIEAGVPLREVQRWIGRHVDIRQTEWYDRSRANLDTHPAYLIAGYIAV